MEQKLYEMEQIPPKKFDKIDAALKKILAKRENLK
jgi:hypothetical protein